ncbi:MAG: biosynthetic peptidoglycan transglycosylase [Bacteroidia bacterium]|nr:transglycosylase domain-containing protein [Bacteroidia bacterium]MDW8157976.1 biosynthetic peptidoglycan transglycosylase [Bacteroidia bacterium]
MSFLKKQKIVIVRLGCIFTLGIIIILSIWQFFGKKFIHFQIQRIAQKYQFSVFYSEIISFSPFKFKLQDVIFQAPHFKIQGKVEFLTVELDKIALLKGNLRPQKIESGKITLTYLKVPEFSSSKIDPSKNSLDLWIEKIGNFSVDKLFWILSKLPSNFQFSSLSLQEAHQKEWIKIFEVRKEDKYLVGKAQLENKNLKWQLYLENYAGKLILACKDTLALPLAKHSLQYYADSTILEYQLHHKKWITFHLRLQNAAFYHKRLNKKFLFFKTLWLEAQLKQFTHQGYGLDSCSKLVINTIPFFIQCKLGHTSLCLNVQTPFVGAQQWLNALPQGAFETLEGMQLKGKLQFALELEHFYQKPADFHFDANLKAQNLYLQKMGATNLAAINGSFSYTPIHSTQVRTIHNEKNFTPLEEVSPFLVPAVLTAEDPAFFYHKGFIMESIKESILENLKVGYFKRGGSTISMQLVKNVFLSPEKTIARKLEEMLLVWLIENMNLVPKKRMLEVYLNIIEWGPNIYGIGEAAYFYFAKSPIELLPEECIFLALIIPFPRYFHYQFDKEGKLHESHQDFFELLATKIQKQTNLDENYFRDIGPHKVILRGPAKYYLKNKIFTKEEILEFEQENF